MRRAGTLLFLALLVAGCGGPRRSPPDAAPMAMMSGPLFGESERRAITAYWTASNRYTVEPSPELWPTWRTKAWIETNRPAPGPARSRLDNYLRDRQAWETALLNLSPGTPRTAIPAAPALPPGLTLPPQPMFARERVNITVPGSMWHWNYAQLVAQRRAAAPADPTTSAEIAAWEAWIKARIAWDKAQVGGGPDAPPPGPIPPALLNALGEPPPLFARVRPNRYTVVFAPGDAAAPFVYTDQVSFADRADRYAYFRSANGVVRYGRPLRDYVGVEKQHIAAVFARAGRDAFERNVLQAVSRLEGGFEAVNTYDTGWVSIGFIQFIAARNGNGSLASVLLRHKTDNPTDFNTTFRRFGVDVAPEGVIVVVDPATGQELRGEPAVQALIDDKRLTAVFERAGYRDNFRLAQVLVARARYWPGDDVVSVPITTVYEQTGTQTRPTALAIVYGVADTQAQTLAAATRMAERRRTDPRYRSWVATRTVSAPVHDLIRSEAGMATLMDRKVNRGNIRSLSDVAADLMRANKLTKIETLIYYEKPIIEAMKYRADFLSDPNLTQPKG